jgi:hypothetical protein
MKRVAPHNSSYENSQRLPHKSFLDPPLIPFPNDVEVLEAYPKTQSIAFNDFRETKEGSTYSIGKSYEANSYQLRKDIVSTPQTFKDRVLVEETDPHRLAQREKQINIGKSLFLRPHALFLLLLIV